MSAGLKALSARAVGGWRVAVSLLPPPYSIPAPDVHPFNKNETQAAASEVPATNWNRWTMGAPGSELTRPDRIILHGLVRVELHHHGQRPERGGYRGGRGVLSARCLCVTGSVAE